MKVLGHVSAGMAMVYAQVTDQTVLRDYQAVLGPGRDDRGAGACLWRWYGCCREFYGSSGLLNWASMAGRQPPGSNLTLPSPSTRVLSNSAAKPRSVRPASKRWQPPEGLSPEEIDAIIDAAAAERDRLLLTTPWATGARISEMLALRPRDITAMAWFCRT